MGLLDAVINQGKRAGNGLRAGVINALGGTPPTPATPSTPLPDITGPATVASPSVPNPTPTSTTLGGDPIPPQAAGYKPNFTVPDGSVPGMEGPGAPSARSAYGAKLAGTSSPEAQAFQASRASAAANPAVEAQVGTAGTAPAAEAGASAAQNSGRTLGRAAFGLGRAAGVATRVASPLVSGAATTTLAAAPLAGFGDYKINDPGVDSSAGGTIGNVLTGNFGAAGDGLRKGAVEAMLDSGSGFAKTGDFVAGLVGAHPNLAGKYDAMVRGDLGNQLLPGAPSAPTPASTAADPTKANAPGIAGPTNFQSNFPAPDSLGLGAGVPSGPPGIPTSVPGIVRDGNSFTNIGTSPNGTDGATTSSGPTGFDLGAANLAQARTNQINQASADAQLQRDRDAGNAGFGTAVATGRTDAQANPRQVVSPGGGIGGLVVQRNLNKQRALDLEQQQILGGQDIQRQDLGLRGKQFAAGQQLDYAKLGETQRHNLVTAGLTQQQIQREAQRDQALNDYHAGELKNTAARTAAEFGPGSLREREFTNTQSQQAIANHAKAGDDYSKSVAGTISTSLRDDKGNVDPNLVAEHVANANGQVTANIARLRAEVQANPSNTAAADALSNYQRNGIAAMSDGEKQRVQSATEFGQLARKYGSSDLNPIGGTNVEMRTPVASIKREGGLTGSVYRGYDANGKPLPITVPARAIETVDGNFIGGTRNQRFKSLIQGAQ